MTSQESGSSQPGQAAAAPTATSEEPAAAPVPAWPSPYLPEGRSIPEAYLAPPQQGQAPYGSLAGPIRPGQPHGSAQPGSGQQGSGHPGFGQRDSGRPGFGRPAPGSRALALRDPALAGGVERMLATLLDWILILAVAVLAMLAPLLRVWHQLETIISGARYGSRSAAQAAALSNVMQAPATVSTVLTLWLLAFAIALAYFWVLSAVWGATLGKRALGLRVVSALDRSRVSVRAAGIRTAIFLLGPAIFLLLPSVEVLGGLLWLADGLVLLMDSARMQCLHDRLAGTVVIRQRWLDRQS